MPSSGYLYAIGAAITWGVVYTLDQRILRDTSPFILLFINSLITALLLLPVLFINKGSLSHLSDLSGKDWVLIILSIVFAALANYFIFSGIKLLGASTASIIEISYPFFVVLFGYFVFQAVPNLFFLIGGILIFAGSALIVYFH